jgi:long-chain acyl-CoA synthetase
MTEASPNVVMAAEDDAGESGAVGVAFPGTRLSIRAPDEPTRTLATGETGEVCIAGPQIMAGYWNRPEETRRAFVDGYFRSGDLGFLDEAGALHLVGRLKDTINASGYKVHPDAVEEAVRQHEAVAEALVIGAPDAYRGETVKAYVVLKPGRSLTLAELQQFLAGRLSPMETPKQLEVRSDLPLTPVGKPSRLALRQEVAAALAAEARSDDGLAAPADPAR